MNLADDLVIMSGVVLFVGGGISLMTSTLFRANGRAWRVLGVGLWIALAGAALMLFGAVAKVVGS